MQNCKRKILFIIPPYFNVNDYIKNPMKTTLPAFTIPYGVLSIDAYMKKNVKKYKIETCIIDLNIKLSKLINKTKECKDSDLLNIIKNELNKCDYDIIAISALFNTSYNYLMNISDIIKKYSSNSLVVTGGGLPTNLYEKILKECSCIDAICYGEGEIPMTDLVNSTDYKKLITNHKSWINKEVIKSKKIPINSFVHNLDDIPEFDYNLVNLNDYNSRSLDKEDLLKENKREMSIHTSRGCPFNCVFCANGKLHGKKVRFMSVKRVITEVENMILNFELTTLIIEDDHFLSDKKRAKEILKKLSDYNIKIEFPNGIAVYPIDEEIGILLKNAGVSVIPLAIESGSDYVLRKIINKPLKVDMIESRVKILRKNDIRIHAFIILGLPGEMDEHRLETIRMLENIGFDWVHIAITIPIVGSRLYDICVKNDYLVNSNMNSHTIYNANIKAPGVDPVEIKEFAYYMNLYINFVNNFNMLHGEYKKAAIYFKNIIEKYPDHAFASYFLSKAYKHMNLDDKLIKEHMINFKNSVDKSEMWKNYVECFKL